MSCEHYWRDGILLVERGEPDPHRESCLECRRAHETRAQLVRALPGVGGTATGAPDWQTRVWSRIAREEASRARRSYWIGGGLVAVAAAAAIVCIWFVQPGDGLVVHKARPQIEIVSGKLAMRSTSARVGDRVRISVDRGQEVRVYRAERLVLRCPARTTSPSCVRDDQGLVQGLVAEAELATAGDYQLVVIPAATADPVGTLDRDLAAVVSAGGNYKITELSVR
jgi:hypothetical protein